MFENVPNNFRFAAITAVLSPETEDRLAAVSFLLAATNSNDLMRSRATLIVQRYKTEGDKLKFIQCVKEVRESTGWGLKDSKDFVDSIWPFPRN